MKTSKTEWSDAVSSDGLDAAFSGLNFYDVFLAINFVLIWNQLWLAYRVAALAKFFVNESVYEKICRRNNLGLDFLD